MKTTLTAAALALALVFPAYAETPQDIPGSSAEGMDSTARWKNQGSLSAPEKDTE